MKKKRRVSLWEIIICAVVVEAIFFSLERVCQLKWWAKQIEFENEQKNKNNESN